jgi:ribosomal protein L15
MRDDDSEITKQRVVDSRGRTRGHPKQGGRGKQAGEESEDEEEAQLGGASGQIVVQQRTPRMFYDHTKGDAFKVPKRAQGKARDKVPDVPLQLRGRIVEDGIVGGYIALLSTASANVSVRAFFG